MKTIIDEYGRFILAIIAALMMFGIIFGSIKVFDGMGKSIDIKPSFSHVDSENSFKEIKYRKKPSIYVPNPDDLKLYKDEVFRPRQVLNCIDNEGNLLEYKITKIVYMDENKRRTDYTDNYNENLDAIILNKFHYSTTHQTCNSLSEFNHDSDNNKYFIKDKLDYNKKGFVYVTCEATDSHGLTTIKTISFAIDIAKYPDDETTTEHYDGSNLTVELINNDSDIPVNEVFRPLSRVNCVDEFNNNKINYCSVEEITYINENSDEIDYTDHYNADDDVIIINKEHYSNGLHDDKCQLNEFINNDNYIVAHTYQYNNKETTTDKEKIFAKTTKENNSEGTLRVKYKTEYKDKVTTKVVYFKIGGWAFPSGSYATDED